VPAYYSREATVALLEETNVCAVCEAPVKGYAGPVPVYFCPTCYGEHKDEIMAAVAWVAVLLGMEKARRKRRNRLLKGVGLPRMQNTLQGVLL
jgi:hypothetical protein